MNNSTNLDSVLKAALLNDGLLPEALQVKQRTYVIQKGITAGFKAAVWQVKDEFGRLRAAKLATPLDYQDRSYLQETAYAARLVAYPCFAQFADAGFTDITLSDGTTCRFVCFIEEWVDGMTLKKFLTEREDQVTISFLLGFVRTMCEALSALQAHGLCHDDLHQDNVMIAPAPLGSLDVSHTIKIIDTGSMKPLGESIKQKDDHRNFIDQIIAIWNVIHGRRAASVRDRRFLSATVELLKVMADDDSTVALRDPAQIAEQFTLAHTRALLSHDPQLLRLSSPFEFLSAEHIPDDRLLVSLFAKSCPWLDKVSGPDPCLVTGPRGCGKSTIFRWLSLKAHLDMPSEELETFRVAGFYISCNTDLQNRLGWINTEALARRFKNEIIHYFNLLSAREVVQTLILLAARPDRESYFGFGPVQERSIHRFLGNMLGESTRPRTQGVSLLMQAREALESEMAHAHSQMLRGVSLSQTTPETFLGDLTTLLVREITFFLHKRPTFLVDDFSVHRIPRPVQIVLNRVIWERRPSHVFKLSSEKYGAVLVDHSNATIDITREMLEIDCGREYIALDDAEQSRKGLVFAVELLDNRLKQSGYRGTADSLIGHSHWEEGSLGSALAVKPQGRGHDQYHGLECIAQLCSGDVSSLLLVYRGIFDAGVTSANSTVTVTKSAQHKAVREASRKKFEAIKPSFPHGQEMYAVVDAFGTLVRNILEHGQPQKKGTQYVPSQCPRIEIDQQSGAVSDMLGERDRDLALELVRRAIFIEMEPGLGRHRNVTTLRWHLRRIFLPTFGAALAKNNAVKSDPDWFKFFLTNPKGACDLIWSNWRKAGSGPELSQRDDRNFQLPFGKD
jgi:serine/threonine protein kinase